MDGGGVTLHVVGDSDLDSITPVGDNGLTWSLTVDGEASNGASAIGINHSLFDRQAVASCLAGAEAEVDVR